MTSRTEAGETTRRAAMAKARESRRPSRLGSQAGAAAKPDRVFDDDAGFPGLLARVMQQARSAPDLPSTVQILLTLDGHVPADVSLRALRLTEECALQALFGVSWRDVEEPGGHLAEPAEPGEPSAFVGELGLTHGGRLVVRVPSQGPLATEEQLVDGALRVPWSAQALAEYTALIGRERLRRVESVAACREWLAVAGGRGRDDLLEQLKSAALRTAPFVLYQEEKRYTNFRERNTLTGKTLWPGHPDCALSSLQGIPLDLWSDSDVVVVVCLTLLVRSVGFARIEEANGTQLALDHVGELLERTRRMYEGVPGGHTVAPAASYRVEDLNTLAVALRERRQELTGTVQLYREIHGPLMHKIERTAGPREETARRLEEQLCARLTERLPLRGATFDELTAGLQAAHGWLAGPHGGFTTGLESLVYETVAAAVEVFEADFAMSRGMRSLPQLITALRDQDWTRITKWDLPHFFCCVVAAPEARRYFGDSAAQLADAAWSMSARMQYNSWHFIAGNLPKVPEVEARDYFAPPSIPDIAYYSDQHHHGHVAARVRFSIRSPQPVEVLGRTFNGFIDLRLLRCEGRPFDEQDLLTAHRASAFVAKATSLMAALAAAGQSAEVTAFDTAWHAATIAVD
ncbi:hypothetical protein OHT59_01940 [Streptomyces sp. NBC_00243]|uniref:hypothetical protein n=1 Tax=Streptomyces sp. NBC_00243 TaxID=2975688 RepID=UPI002DD8FA8C|nr:hypothetical protein [Streptomyces sp. NBC_00243]WRZ17323.1 hypothetical protein OHT59_01940 [Streptomyces sp. NBC_00243]